ncbi:amino acid adenylation [Fusarium sp. NRRL 52700]|nr:amino acid adenylation [Fusarium sp. NRRL 52700]
MDGQVKIHGYRIELGEIEHVLQSHEAVIGAVAVIHRQIDQELSIACFITVSRDDGDLSSAEKSKLQKDLNQKSRMQLPLYMVPQTITAVDAMPLTINGKVNCRALAERAPTIQAEEALKRQPTSFMERHMQKVWAEVLNIGTQDIGLDGSFFRLGGNSITTMKLVAEARKAGIRFAIADVFRYNTLGELASQQTSTTVQSDEELDSVTLVSPDEKANLLKAIDLLKIKLTSNEILDILPITSFQERALGSW